MVSIQSFGAFVKLQDSGVEGLVHVSQIKAGYIGAVSDEVAVGDEVQVRCCKFCSFLGLCLAPAFRVQGCVLCTRRRTLMQTT